MTPSVTNGIIWKGDNMQKYIIFNGISFCRDDKTGYYLNSTLRKRLHRYVWEYYNGEIPKGYQIHHIDGDKSNNDIGNLQLISRKKHAELHNREKVESHYEELVENFEKNARPKAIEWHKSEEGREWHKKQYEATKGNLHARRVFKCKNCGKTYEATRAGFCCNACKSAYRRKIGADLIEIECEYCNKKFKANKYKGTRFCSQACVNKAAKRI